MPARKGVDRHRDRIERWLAEGASYCEIGRRLGVEKQAVIYWARKWGVKSAHPAGRDNAILVEVRGEKLSLQATARKYGLLFRTVHYRYHRGDRGEALIRPARPLKRPEVYHVGASMADWQTYVALAREVGVRKAERTLRIPSGAIGAAIRGEWHRLA